MPSVPQPNLVLPPRRKSWWDGDHPLARRFFGGFAFFGLVVFLIIVASIIF